MTSFPNVDLKNQPQALNIQHTLNSNVQENNLIGRDRGEAV